MNDALYDKLPKDKRALHQQRAVLLTTDDKVVKHKAYNERQAPAREKRKARSQFKKSIKTLSKGKQKMESKKYNLMNRAAKIQQQLAELQNILE